MNKIKFVLGLIAIVTLSGCWMDDPEGAIRVLRSAGYTKIQLTGYRFTGCSKDDNLHTGFEAVGPTGMPVTGVVCGQFVIAGWPKGSTIRID